jgi:hypothetical protein
MKIVKFRKELVLVITHQLIKAKMEHYVVVLGQEYTLQVKYRKRSMIRFEVCGWPLLMYEVPYICVPTLEDTDMVQDEELDKIPNKDQS